MIKAIILDMDGTLVDTGKIGFSVFEKHLIKHNCKYTKEQVKSIGNMGFTDVFKDILKENNIEFKQEMIEDMKKDYTNRILDAKLLPYAYELLESIHEKAIMVLATFSLTYQANIILENTDIKKYFDKIVCADSKLFKQKKHQLKDILDELKLKPSECILVEDSHYGIESGMHNKIFTIGVTHSFDDIKADIIVNDLNKVKKILLEKLSMGG
jgi:HAD superfamily hydrolase (TIGR01509 family)